MLYKVVELVLPVDALPVLVQAVASCYLIHYHMHQYHTGILVLGPSI